MFRNEESNGNFRLQSNTVYEPQSILFISTFKHKHGEKVNTQTFCVFRKLQMNYKKSFNKTVKKHFFRISCRDFGNQRNHKTCMHVFACTFI